MLLKTLKTSAAIGVGLLLLAGCSSEQTPTEKIKSALSIAQSTQGDGDPAIWLLADEDTQIYMIGTVHILPDGIKWQTAKFDEIMANTDTLFLEADVKSPEAQMAGQQLIVEYAMFEEGQTLTGVLGDDAETVSAAFDSIGLPMKNFDGFKPWMGGLTLQLMSLVNDGYNVESGLETILTEMATANNIEMDYLETVEEQMKFLSGGTLEEQVEGLVFMANTLELGKETMSVLVDEWVDGDVEGLGVIVAIPELLGGQGVYDRLLFERNTNWVPLIEDMLDEPGTKLVAVGAAHLAGPDSVITMLENKGHTIEFVQ